MSKDFNFVIGDIIQLKKATDNSNPFKSESPKLFKIADITGESVKLGWELKTVSITEIKPILVDSVEDTSINLHHKGVKYSFLMPGMVDINKAFTPEYYLDSIRKLGWEDLVKKIKAKEFTFVNEVQRYINMYFKDYYLEVNLK